MKPTPSLSDSERKKFEVRLLWDVDMDLDTFFDYLYGRKEDGGWINSDWALIRAIDQLSYHELRRFVSLEQIKEAWPRIKDKIRHSPKKEGLEFILQRETVSNSRSRS